jgi:hypothetical protein
VVVVLPLQHSSLAAVGFGVAGEHHEEPSKTKQGWNRTLSWVRRDVVQVKEEVEKLVCVLQLKGFRAFVMQ